jgi:hypothetical protein
MQGAADIEVVNAPKATGMPCGCFSDVWMDSACTSASFAKILDSGQCRPKTTDKTLISCDPVHASAVCVLVSVFVLSTQFLDDGNGLVLIIGNDFRCCGAYSQISPDESAGRLAIVNRY